MRGDRTRLTTFALTLVLLLNIGAGGDSRRDRPDPDERDRWPRATKELEQAQRAIERGHYQTARTYLLSVLRVRPDDADARNLLGYSLRNLRRYDEALKEYRKALEIDPEHRGALEYMGEAYLKLDRPTRAQALLRRLEKACPEGCPERTQLEKAIAAGQAGANAGPPPPAQERSS